MPHIKKMVMQGFKSFASKTEIPFENAMNVIVGPNGSGKSCHYDTLILGTDGKEKKIGELVEEKINQAKIIKKLDDGVYVDAFCGMEVFSLNKDTMKIEAKKVSKFIKREGEVIYKIKTKSGREVKATGCHPVMVFKDGKVTSSLIQDLKHEDFIAAPRILEIAGKDFDSETARFIGYIIGDGYISKDRIEFVNNDAEVLEDYKRILQKFCVDYSERKDKKITRIYINNVLFCRKIKEMFIKNHKGSITSSIKKIPDELLSANRQATSNLLSGLFDTDGSIRKDIGVIEFCTKNKELANQIQGLLLRFGIICKIKKRQCCASNTEKKIKRDYFYIYIYGQENLQKFYSVIPLRVKHKLDNLISHIEKNITPNPNRDLLPKEINSYIKDISWLLGIKIKLQRKNYPFWQAYAENRCLPTRKGVQKIILVLEQKLRSLQDYSCNLQLSPKYLINCMDSLAISGQSASQQIGMNKGIIRNIWEKNIFSPKHENLQKFYDFIKESLFLRIEKASKILDLLKNIANSDIYWDEISSIEKLEKEKFVYDLTIEDNHNFIANNVFVHNSNVTDALCFVLGRLSIKSMRAAKAANLLFSGNKNHKPANEAFVELVFDNSDRVFAMESSEISIKRIVRRNGLSIYKINNEVKTRQELLELLATAGIDPNGFNIVLQGEIDSLVKSHPEERRKIIEEVAGISIYESRKHKSLLELEKSDERLKEVNAVLKERSAYLRNLEKERQEALNFQKLEETIKRCKGTILSRKINEKEKELISISINIENQQKQIEKIRHEISKHQQSVQDLENKIIQINKSLQASTSSGQEGLHKEIADLKARIAGMQVRKENFENRVESSERKAAETREKIKFLEKEIGNMKTSSPEIKKQHEEVKKQQEMFDILEKKRRQFYLVKSELNTLESKRSEKEKTLIELKKEQEFSERSISLLFEEIRHAKSIERAIQLKEKIRKDIEESEKKLSALSNEDLALIKDSAVVNQSLSREEKLKHDIVKLDVCPLCQSKITQEHVNHVIDEANRKISSMMKKQKQDDDKKQEIEKKSSELRQYISSIKSQLSELEIDIVKIKNAEDKKNQIKRIFESQEQARNSLHEINARLAEVRKEFEKLKNIEQEYDESRLKLQDLSFKDMDIDSEISVKQREINRLQVELKSATRDNEESLQELKLLNERLGESQKAIDKKEQEEKELYEKFQKMFEERNGLQDEQKAIETLIIGMQHEIRGHEDKINMFRIQKAKVDAESDAFKMEFKEFEKFELIQAPINEINERLQKCQLKIQEIGSVNLRALEIYETVREQCRQIEEKMQTVQKEKENIMKIIEEIDKKKKKAFFKTLEAVNVFFTRNFAQLSRKGEVFLDIENKQDPFAGGVNIILKVAKGKYFDVTSLSGGEKTLVALSLIFAIQEYKPYYFYVFDEIDAALDKHNSERLAALIKRYMTSGQYIIVTHNDALITEASALYGVSMQENMSKVISLKV